MKKYLTSKLNYCRNNLSYVNHLTNLYTISMIIVLMIIVNTSIFSQCDEKLDFCDFKKVEPPLQTVHYIIHFDSKGRIIGGVPTILRRGNYIRFAIDGVNATLLETKLNSTIKKFNTILNESNYAKLIENPVFELVFPTENEFTQYKTDFQSCELNAPTNINNIFKASITYPTEPCDKPANALKFIPKECGYITEPDFEILCDSKFNEINFQLKMEDLYFKTVREYFGKTLSDCCVKSNTKFNDWDILKTPFNSIQNEFNDAAKIINQELAKWYIEQLKNPEASIPDALLKEVNDIQSLCEIINQEIGNKVVEANNEWMKGWLWYTGLENPVINPFRPSKDVITKANQLEKDIESLEGRINDFKSILDKTKLPDQDDKILQKSLSEIDAMRTKLVELKNQKSGLDKQVKAYNDLRSNLSSGGKILNLGKLFVSDAKGVFWMPQFDAANDYRLINRKNTLPEMVSGMDEVRPLAINVPKGTKVSSEETVKGYTPQTPLAEGFDVFGGVFDRILNLAKNTNISVVDGILNGLSASIFTKELSHLSNIKSFSESKIMFADFQAKDNKFDQELEKLKAFESQLEIFNKTQKLLTWYSNQTYPELEKIEVSKPDTVFHTDWARPKTSEDKKGSNIISYTLKANDGKKTETIVLKETYKIFEPQRFWYGVGLAYVPEARNTNVFDSNTNTFQVNPEPQQFDIIVGAKWYPFVGMNETRTRERAKFTNYGSSYQYPRGNGNMNRVSVFLGLGVRYKFLRNYFLGVGYDIIPGLNIQVGGNAYFENRYELKNGKLDQAYERLVLNRGYFAITTDVSVFTRLIKLINPF